MNDTTMTFGVTLIALSIFFLAAINLFLVWRLLKGLRHEAQQLDGIVEQCERLGTEQAKVKQIVATPPEKLLDTSTLEALDQALSDSQEMFDQSALGLGDVVFELQNLDDSDLADWRRQNEKRIAELLSNRNALRTQVDNLQELLSKANASVLNLRAKVAVDSATGDSKVAEELQQARRNSARLAGELGAATQNIQTLNGLLSTRDRKLQEAEEVLAQEKHQLSAERDALKSKVDELQALMERTLVEKSFIEDAFLESEARERPA